MYFFIALSLYPFSFFANNPFKQGEFKIFRIILVLPVVDFILCIKEKDLIGRESILNKSMNCLMSGLLVVLKSTFCVNPSIEIADKSLFEMTQTKCKNKAKGREKKIREKREIFAKRFFLFTGNPK